MTKNEMNAVVLDAFGKIFASKAQGIDIASMSVSTNMGIFSGRWFNNSATSQKTLRGFDVMLNMGAGVAKIRLIEQNPNKPSEPGRRAAMGSRIMWVIDQRTNNFLSSVENGVIIAGRIQGITPVKKAVVAPTLPAVQLPEEIHEFAGDPADEVLHYYDGYESDEAIRPGVPTDEEWSW